MVTTGAPRGKPGRARTHPRAAIGLHAPARSSLRLPASLEPLFWPRALEELRTPERTNVLFLHVLARGNARQVSWLRRRFGDRAIRRWIRKRNGWGIGADRVAPWVDGEEVLAWWQSDPALENWARWGLVSAAEAPVSVVRLLKSYEPGALLWAEPAHRYIVVREILTRGDGEARAWLWTTMERRQVIELVRDHRAAGLAEPDRAKLRDELGLTTDDLPTRPYLGIW